MTTALPPEEASHTIDRQDERLRTDEEAGGSIRASLERIRAGDLGALPVIVGIAVIAVIFQSLNSNFLSSANLENLLLESSAVGVIALGIVCVLLVGEIDLSVGSVSGLAAAILGVTFVNSDWPLPIALFLAIGSGTLIGVVYSQVYLRFGVPSFVITLAGLLGFVGLKLRVLGTSGTINLPFDSPIVEFGQRMFVPAPLSYALAVLAAISFAVVRTRHARRRSLAGLSFVATKVIIIQSVVLASALLAGLIYINQSRGVGWMFVFFVGLVMLMNYMLTRTKWGRAVFAVGGNREAARRSGVNVNSVYISVFALCSTFAAVGGILAAGRLAAAAQSSGEGDVNLNAIAAAVIGGTSLFGGRGSAVSALLGILVISSISSGLTLLSLSSSWRFMVTGAVLLLAVILDSVSRRSRASRGAA